MNEPFNITETPESMMIGPATIALLLESRVKLALILLVFILTGVEVTAKLEASFAGVIAPSDTVAKLCASPMTVIKSIVSVESIASAKLITPLLSVNADPGFCIVPLTDTISCSAIRLVWFCPSFNKVYEDLSDKNYNRDEDLIKYFKSEYGKEWKIELDKHLLKTEFDINKKAA